MFQLPSSWPKARVKGGLNSGRCHHIMQRRGRVPNCANLLFFRVLGDSGDAPALCFFVFCMDLSSKTPSFESLFGRLPARDALKTRCVSREGSVLSSTVKNINLEQFGTHPWIHRIPPIRCQEPQLGTTLPRAPGAKMAWVKTNSLK